MRAVITDFGMAHQPDAAPGTVFAAQRGGTPGYMAPELWRGEKSTIASDLYALGVVLFELISRPPAGSDRQPPALGCLHPDLDNGPFTAPRGRAVAVLLCIRNGTLSWRAASMRIQHGDTTRPARCSGPSRPRGRACGF